MKNLLKKLETPRNNTIFALENKKTCGLTSGKTITEPVGIP
ncbi:hypothetical protein HMPREF6485_0366 [Segatella buccae ATCC 33574]|uniref:Uncharacterized protein n=1 Tax=Segatella buccae ATCC 33574 TaxID=873513 RepID=E6K421_9BACT|nr:hypothetical protein HMPREF6485_0366 [Segatella buccae ATCC 33574]